MKRAEYPVKIWPANNGITVHIGCKTLVFTEASLDDFLLDLKAYLTGGYEAQQQLLEKYCLEKHNHCELAPAPPTQTAREQQYRQPEAGCETAEARY